MINRKNKHFICRECGAKSGKWSGHCEACDAWNSFIEQEKKSPLDPRNSSSKGLIFPLFTLDGDASKSPTTPVGIPELDRVLGGGLVPGSAILVGGDPGIGKSTLLIQAASSLAKKKRVVYISGEESIAQVQLRAQRLGMASAPVSLGTETNVENILATLEKGETPALLIIDSIQTMWTDMVESPPGTVSQLRATTQILVRFAKSSSTAVILVGHVTKDGQIAGPRVIEHMVDAVLYFEGDNAHQFRILRAVKNRFGPTDEMGVFEMTGGGLSEITNPSALFLGERETTSPGTAVFAGMEGTRPLLVELQALTASSPFGTPRRSVVGWDSQRLSMILAVLEARCGLKFGTQDIYLNVAGGLRIQEPAADLAAAAAIISSLTNTSLPRKCIYFGEIALSGTIRKVPQTSSRLREAEKLGFTSAVGPKESRIPGKNDKIGKNYNLSFSQIETLSILVSKLLNEKKRIKIKTEK